MKSRIPVSVYLSLSLLVAGLLLSHYKLCARHHLAPSAVVVRLPNTIGSVCGMEEAHFDAQTAKTGREPSAWYWRDSQGHFCADMHHVNNPDAGMDDWRSVYAIGINSNAVFEHETDAVRWVESQPYIYRGTR